MRVLIVERERGNRAALRLFIEIETGAEVVGEAASAREGATAISMLRPDIVVVDWELPGGAALLRGALTDGATPAVVALSSRPESRRDALLGGADAFVCKCDPPEKIAQALAAIKLSTRLPNATQQANLAVGPETS